MFIRISLKSFLMPAIKNVHQTEANAVLRLSFYFARLSVTVVTRKQEPINMVKL